MFQSEDFFTSAKLKTVTVVVLHLESLTDGNASLYLFDISESDKLLMC